MTNIQIVLSLFLLVVGLMGCKEEIHDKSYLLMHPAVLRQEVADCRAEGDKSKTQLEHCEVVLQTAADFMSLLDAQQADPEKFGEQVLTAQSQCANDYLAQVQAQQAVSELELKSASANKLKLAKDRLAKAQQVFQEQQLQVQALQAILGLSSPE